MITVGQHEKNEWSRMAQAAYSAGRNDVGHRFSGAASIPNGAQLTCAQWDNLMSQYRAWLCFNEFAPRVEVAS